MKTLPPGMNLPLVVVAWAHRSRIWLLLAAAWVCQVAVAAEFAAEPPTAGRRAELISLVRQDCGSCHGLSLKGGLGPALLPESLRDKPADSLKWTILQGRPGTPMPPWQRFLTEADADWIVSQLQKGFPSEH
jgi:cytochrome c55X